MRDRPYLMYRLYMLLLMICVCDGCQRVVMIHFINNTETNITIQTLDAPNRHRSYVAPAKGSTYIQSCYRFEVIQSGITNAYSKETLPRSYFQSGPKGSLEIDIQLNTNGLIYVLDRKSDTPVDSLGAQPPGYPLSPK